MQERTRGSQSSEVQARRAALAEQRQREMLLVQQELAARRQQQQQGGGSGGAVGGKVLVDFVRGDGEDGSSRGGGADGPEQRPEVRADEQRHAPGPWSDSAATATSEDPAANTTTSASDSGTARDGGVDPSDDAAGQDVGRTKPVDTNPWGGADREGGRVRTGEAGLWNAESFPAPGGDGLDDDQPRVRPLTVEEASVRPSAQGKVLFDPYKGEKYGGIACRCYAYWYYSFGIGVFRYSFVQLCVVAVILILGVVTECALSASNGHVAARTFACTTHARK